MANIQTTKEIQITTSATNFTLNTYDEADLYTIYTAAPLTILGTSTITATGTLNIGLTYKFNYIAEITGGTLTIFGETIPTHLLSKNCEIVAIYTDAGWSVKLTPNFFKADVVSDDALVNVVDPYKVVTYRITQSSTNAPTVVTLNNTLGATPTLAYGSAGVYTISTSALFTSNKTTVIHTGSTGVLGKTVQFSYTSTSIITMYTWTEAGSLTNGLLQDDFLEIRVYN